MKLTRLLFILIITFNLPKLSQAQAAYYCPPCNNSYDQEAFDEPGVCIHCGMKLEQRSEEKQMELLESQEKESKTIAFYLHEGIEILDWAGPAEVFTVAGFEVVTVSHDGKPITSQDVFEINPMYSLDNCPKVDIVAFFGGNSGKAIKNKKAIAWLKERNEEVDLVFSVCTGAFFLAKAGLLDGQIATTFHASIDALRKAAPKAEIIEDVKYVDNGRIITTAGVSSGIHGALYLVKKLMGMERAKSVADYMEYENWTGEDGLVKN